MFVASKAPLCTFHQPSYGCCNLPGSILLQFPTSQHIRTPPYGITWDRLDMHSTETIGDLQLHMSSRDEAHARRGLAGKSGKVSLGDYPPGPQLPHLISKYLQTTSGLGQESFQLLRLVLPTCQLCPWCSNWTTAFFGRNWTQTGQSPASQCL